jgi:predicted Zn-dependent protease
VALCELDRVEEGIAAFRRAAALNPDYLVPRINLAFAQLRAGQFKEAETQLEAVLEQDPTSPRLHQARGAADRAPPRAARGSGAGERAMRAAAFGLSDVGRRRESNEDAFWWTRADLYVIADGMGGYAAGRWPRASPWTR